MKIDEFIKKYTDGNIVFEKHVLNKYVPIAQKQAVAKRIVESCAYRNDGKYSVTTVAKYILIRMSLFDIYTDIDRNDEEGYNIVSDFDKLNELRIFDELLERMNHKELKEMLEVIEMEFADARIKETDPENFVRNQVERFGVLIGNTLGPVLQGLDMEKVGLALKDYLDGVKDEG